MNASHRVILAYSSRIEAAPEGTCNTRRGLTRSYSYDMEGLSWSLPKQPAAALSRSAQSVGTNLLKSTAPNAQEATYGGHTATHAGPKLGGLSITPRRTPSVSYSTATSATYATDRRPPHATALSDFSTRIMTTSQGNGVAYSAPGATRRSACSMTTPRCSNVQSSTCRTLPGLSSWMINRQRRAKLGAPAHWLPKFSVNNKPASAGAF